MQVLIKLLCWPLMLLITIASTGIVLNGHVCQNKLTSFALFVQADNCGASCEDSGLKDYETEQGSHYHKKKCCQQITAFDKVDVISQIVSLTNRFQPAVRLNDFKIAINNPIEHSTNQLNITHWQPPNYGLPILDCTQCLLI